MPISDVVFSINRLLQHVLETSEYFLQSTQRLS